MKSLRGSAISFWHQLTHEGAGEGFTMSWWITRSDRYRPAQRLVIDDHEHGPQFLASKGKPPSQPARQPAKSRWPRNRSQCWASSVGSLIASSGIALHERGWSRLNGSPQAGPVRRHSCRLNASGPTQAIGFAQPILQRRKCVLPWSSITCRRQKPEFWLKVSMAA